MKRGFTLIEVIMYMALYSILIGGVIVALFTLFESQTRNQSIALLQQEGDFVASRIAYEIRSAHSVISPITSGGTLDLVRSQGTHTRVYLINQNVILEINSVAAILNSDAVAIQNLQFTHTIVSNPDESYDVIEGQFIGMATTSDGHMLSRTFRLHSLMQ